MTRPGDQLTATEALVKAIHELDQALIAELDDRQATPASIAAVARRAVTKVYQQCSSEFEKRIE